jgi:hypothetical protein
LHQTGPKALGPFRAEEVGGLAVLAYLSLVQGVVSRDKVVKDGTSVGREAVLSFRRSLVVGSSAPTITEIIGKIERGAILGTSVVGNPGLRLLRPDHLFLAAQHPGRC